jgi:putative ABC transport system ATP-binding protein
MSSLSLEHVTLRYRDGREEITALDDVSLEVYPGEYLGIWGTRRAGKTTLLRVAAGRLLPDQGAVRFAGRDITRISGDERARLQRRGGIGLVSGDWRPQRHQPVGEHVALGLLSDGMSLREARGPAWRALERVGMSGCAYMPATRLSLGERFRVQIARALVHDPRVLLVDEPTMWSRPSEAVELYELLRALGVGSSAVVVASEELAPIRMAHRIVGIDGGRLRSMQEPGTIVQFPEVSRRRS